MNTKKRVIAIHLPQFHPFKENDEWWGKGFTEWTNVAKARPRYRGHYQPHIPKDLGFYDLRLPESRLAQAELAKEYGIYGFCYYHYWFSGHLLMERPIDEILESKEPQFPFMMCWANENWTRAWNGSKNQILIEQKYSDEDDYNHIHYLLDHIFCDERYIRINGKPVFAIYRSSSFPNIKRTIEIWRNEAKKKGVELYICRFESFNEKVTNLQELGFDAAIEFPPHSISPYVIKHNSLRQYINALTKRVFNCSVWKNSTFNYSFYVKLRMNERNPEYKRYSCITPMWDNSPRRKNGYFVLKGSTPELYRKLLYNLYTRFKPYSNEENLFFINAWNEWAEGNHLEPDLKWGRQYLEATKDVIK